MSNFKFYGTSNFKLIEKFENINTTDFPFVGDSSNTSDCEYKNSFISAKNINIKKLIKDLSSSSHFKRNKFDVNDYKNSISPRFENYKEKEIKEREIVKNTIKPIQQKVIFEPNKVTNNQLERGIEVLNYNSLSYDLSLNTSKCYLNNKAENNSYEIKIDIANKSVSYTYYIYFKDSVEKNDGKAAIILKTSGPELLLFFLEKVYGKYEAKKVRKAIWKKFIYTLYEQNSITSLIFLYDKLPSFMRSGYYTEAEKEKKPYKISDELLWKHFKMFADYDKGRKDASYYVIYLMTLITPRYCMQRFMEDQRFVIQVYENLDDQGVVDTFFGWYDFSRTFSSKNSFEPTNKDVFVTLLNSYVQLFEGDSNVCIFEDSGAHFYQGIQDLRPSAREEFQHIITYGLDADIEEDKIHLENYWQSEERLGYTLIPSNRFKPSRSIVNKVISNGYNEVGNYNPLDIIKFTQYNDKGEAVTMNAPAIFIKHASDVKEWERIGKVIRLGFNLLMIVGSAATIYSGASSMMLYAAITDMGLATGDIFVQEKLAKGDYGTKEGREFLALWDDIYNKVGLLTFSPVAVKLVATNAPKIVNLGADLLQVTGKRIYKKEALKKVQEFTLKAIHNIEIPNFNKTGLRIVPLGQKIAGLKNISKLQKVGVIFVKGGKNTVAAIYKGVVIAWGKVKIVALQLRTALRKLRGDKLKKHLDDIVELAGSAENLRVIRDVDAFIASRARLDSLKITGENALEYLDEALPHFNHKVVARYVNGVLFKEVVKIGRENCVSIVEVIEEYLKTGKITKADSVKNLEIAPLELKYGFFQSVKNKEEIISKVKNGKRGIVYGIRKREMVINYNGVAGSVTRGHVFNFVTKDRKVLFRDGQSGVEAIFEEGFEELKFLITN